MRKRWSLSVPMDGFALPELTEVAREAERLGYTDAWSFEVDGVDAFTPLTVIGLATQMRIGTAIANVYTRGPATLASTAAGLAEIAPGRFVLGIGAGSQPIVEAWNGGKFSRPATRVRETAQFLRAALAGERVVFKGETFTVDGFRLTQGPRATSTDPHRGASRRDADGRGPGGRRRDPRTGSRPTTCRAPSPWCARPRSRPAAIPRPSRSPRGSSSTSIRPGRSRSWWCAATSRDT